MKLKKLMTAGVIAMLAVGQMGSGVAVYANNHSEFNI